MHPTRSEPIAIVGCGCRFPGGASSPSSLWKLLEKPRDVSTDIPDDRFGLKGYYHPKGAHHGTTNVQRAYMLQEDFRKFDTGFFNISPNEAESMDPQQRLLMEVVYEALEASGHTIEGLRGSDTAVFVGTMSVDYNDIVMRDIDTTPTYFATGSSRAILANRISYFFDWHGPSMTIDTACSSSMVALHQCVQSLRAGESRVAVAGGTELLLGPEQFVSESKMNLLSPTGTSRMWDAEANGYARGDGIAAVVLKKLSDAIADGDEIECLIRETGVNQDGKSTGLTVPSSEAQAALIQGTYSRAGLDLADPRNWPQYFEAHGTGTKVGDPREANAIQTAFNGPAVNGNPLYVGSIKTIIGHTEGTAGLAGVLKAALAIRNGTIPPNMLLNRLNPDVQQYCNNLHVPTAAISWPSLPEGVPRRASVNSFGFGGTNGHAILESYQHSKEESTAESVANLAPFTPFTFSAASDESLVALFQSYSEFLKEQNKICLRDLAWTLQSRRSALQVKTALSASTIKGLVSQIDRKLEQVKNSPETKIGVRSRPAKPRLLGVFTGQGAQWATMGSHLIQSSAVVRGKIEELDYALATLPENDRPSWRIADELLAGKDISRLGEAALSQPLCTAIQVVLVDLLRSAGITFQAVVGHSSGEIAAAYAADFISASDAVRIAYYRGVHAKHAQGPKGQKGAMLAVGTSWDDAQELLDLPAFKGRAKIAAHNSGASVTLSGDTDGIDHAKRVFDEEKKFARRLIVDTAYHSHHMVPCSDPYVNSLRACGIKVNPNRDTSCTWYSSVKPGERMEAIPDLCDLYWRDNMVNAVLFTEAVQSAATAEELNLAVEVGPHPALKGPATQSLSDIEKSVPYTGVLGRNQNDIEAFSDALGFLWTHLGPGSVDFQAYQSLVSPGPTPKLVVALPSYPWNHSQTNWHESRKAKSMSLRESAFHELLGVPSPNNTDHDLRWTNFLKANEIDWLDGHQLQGQTVFPAAGYVAMALEASQFLAGSRSVQVFEVQDLTIHKAITFNDGASFAVETLVALTGISPGGPNAKTQTADFAVYSCPNTGTVSMDLVSSGKVKIFYGEPSFYTLSSSPLDATEMAEVDSDRFYESLLELGYGYNGPFKTLTSTKRTLNHASAFLSTYSYHDDDNPLMVHPSMLDVAFQASFLAQSTPGDEQLWSLHVPTSIKCIRVNPELCGSLPGSSTQLPLSAVLHAPDGISVRSSIDVFDENGQETLLQVEELVMKPFSPATASDDRPMFSTTQYGVVMPDGNMAIGFDRPSAEETEVAELCERLAYYFIQKWNREIAEDEWESSQTDCGYLRYAMNQLLIKVNRSLHPSVKEEWSTDTMDRIELLLSRYSENFDIKLIRAVGENMPAVVRREYIDLNHAMQYNMVDTLYSDGLGFSKYNVFLARMTKQITHRYPHVKILELDARAGHATKRILETIGHSFASYSYTDPSPEFIKSAAEEFKIFGQRLTFKVLDPEQTPSSQGFEENSYDVVIASNALHAASSLERRLVNARRLLRPGGFLLASGITNDQSIRMLALMEGQREWLGVDNESGRKKNSTRISTWHDTLRRVGFAGIDTMVPEIDGLAWPFSVIAAQAVDNRINFLRKPLFFPSTSRLDELVVLGTGSLKTARLAEEISDLISPLGTKVTILEGLPTDDDDIPPMSTFINLVDLEEPIFKNLTEDTMEGLKCLFELASNVVWVIEGARTAEPYHNASLGFGRTISAEMSHLSLQFLDLADAGVSASRLISEAVLRLAALEMWDETGTLHREILWSKELELYLENNQLMIPRIVSVDDQNARINSLRRPVTKMVDPESAIVCISHDTDTAVVLREECVPSTLEDGMISVQVTHSILSAINVGQETYLFLGLGADRTTGETVIQLSEINASQTLTSISHRITVPSGKESTFLTAVGSELLAASLLSSLPQSSHVLVHEPGLDRVVSIALARQAVMNNISVTFSTTKLEKHKGWIQLSPWNSSHMIKRSLPVNLTHFLNLATDDEGKRASARIREALPAGCREINSSNLFRPQSLQLCSGDNDILATLREAVNRVRTGVFNGAPLNGTVIPSHVVSNTVQHDPLTIIDWTSERTIAVAVQPINANRLFSRNKTYILVGLSGALGRSICEWMSQNGAGYICLTSRSCKSDNKWQAAMKKAGTEVMFYTMDVTNKQELSKTVAKIKHTCPPIAGVMNGAAVFHDAAFSEMSLEIMEKVLKPKIDGTRNLDEVFSDSKLDFFIVFSSLTSVVGNSGQSNYTAANAYMTGLMGQRRNRGLAGTSLDIGRLAGIGFVERAGDTVRQQLIRCGFMAISEGDLHQLLAEAILAGYPGSNTGPILTTGCRTAREDDDVLVPWFNDARLSHKVVIEARSHDAKADSMKSSLPVREQLAKVTTKEDALEVLKACFATKLAMISRLAEGQTVDYNIPLVEYGIDSLVAVEVRGWFLKELKTDMPVLKVLGGGSVAVLCQEALEKLPESYLPALGTKGSSKPSKVATKVLPVSKPPLSKVESVSERSTAPSAGTSSGSRSPIDTPTTSISTVPSNLDLVGFSDKQRQDVDRVQKPETTYVRKDVMSFPQSRFWFLRLLIEDQTTFNVAFYYRVTGNLRIGDLERAVRLVTNRHESCRTSFVADETEADLAFQKVLPSSLVRLERKKINRFEDVEVEYMAMKATPFDLSSGRLLRLILLSLSATEHYLLFNYHHILMDGVSVQNFLIDLEKAYQRQPLGAPPCQLPDLSRRQRAAFENGDFDEEVAYWRSEFPNGDHPILPLLPMAQVGSRIPTKSFNVHQVGRDLEPALVSRIREVSKASRSTTFHFYLAVFKSMLMRFTDVDDLTIGIADANRTDEDAIGVVGLLLNLLTLRFKRDLAQSFHDSVAEARSKTYGALANSRVPFDVLLKELNVRRSSAYSPFFQAFFDYRQGTHWKQRFANTQLELLELSPGRTAYDLTLDITDTPDGARILLRTQAVLYDRTAAQLLLNTYVHLLDVFASDTSLKLKDPPLFSDNELRRALDVGRGPILNSTWPGGTLPHRIEQIVAEKKDSVAVMDGHGKVLTYAAMHDRIQAIAEALQTVGVSQGSRVLVFEDATADWPCSMLAIMRLGAVYVPLDLRNPLPRLADVAASCKPVAILVDETTADNAPQINIINSQVVNLSSVPVKPSFPIPNSALPDSIAAILYTSGSTGKPKGIMVKHSGLRNEIEGYTKTWGLKAERVLQQSAFTFNHSSDQMYTGLVNGGTVYIVPWSKRGDPIEITKIIRDEGITYTKATPAEYSLWLEYGCGHLKQASSWRFAFGGGESLTGALTQSLAALDLPALHFFNSYGPTEISISSTKMEIAYRDPRPQGRIPCGHSLPNYTAYILDEQRHPVPIGMPGELWIGGAGVSLGYLDNQDLTNEHFVPDPFATSEYIARGWTRMYRTGDIAHLQEDGAMVFHHRVAGDSQVKIRGLRIELGDIESNIVTAAEGALKEAAVTLRDGDPPFLVAHVVFAPHHSISDTHIFLQQLLRKLQVPQYMVPVMAIPLDRMPLSNHSKVDRKALKALPLPVVLANSTDEPSEQSRLSPTMTRLRQVWEEVLKTKELGLKITPSTDFFSIGGNSLLAVRLQSRITHTFNVTLPLVDLLGASTIREMAQRIEENASPVRRIDWEQETALPELALPGAFSSIRSVRGTDKVVLITGAGGFLGKHILERLVVRPEIAQVHCIGLRDKPAGSPRELAVLSPKIILHRGDLSDQWLGLGESTFMKLVNEVDCILHMAAVRSFWDSYHLLYQSNVLPTKQLIRMAAKHRVPVHYVSTAGVFPQDAPNKAGSASIYLPLVDGSSGYTTSRWVSEQVLERAASTLGVPVSIHRFIPGSTITPVATVRAALEHFITFVDKMSLMPDFTGIHGHFEMLLVEAAASQLATALYDSEPFNTLGFRHHECPVRIEIADMQAFLEARRGDKGLPKMPLLKFVGRMKALGLQYFVTSQTLRMEGATEDGSMEILESRR